MIGKLKGIVDSYGEDFVIIDVGGVGYVVHCPARTLQALPPPGERVTLCIETHVREDQIRLFGFAGEIEREWFRLLQTVQGVGTKVALSVLSTLKPAELATAVGLRDGVARARPGSARKWPNALSPSSKTRSRRRPSTPCSPSCRVRSTRAVRPRRWSKPCQRWSISAMASPKPRPPSRPRRARVSRPIPRISFDWG